MSTNTELLREILQVVNRHTYQLEKLESRMSTIETRVSNTDAKLSQYIEKNSTIQEKIQIYLFQCIIFIQF